MNGKIKKTVLGLLIAAFSAAILAGAAIGCLYAFNRPTLTVNAAQKTGEVTNGASGFLYGFAEPDIPSAEIAESIGISALSTKPIGGLQHPIGDVSQVADTFFAAGGEQIIVYTQDMYDTWYYQFDSLAQYHERVRQTVTQSAAMPYADKLVYCIYNETDNGVWFGDFKEYENRIKAYEAWKSTYTLVKSIDPNAKIGGPGYASYNSDYIKEFLAYCKAENCLPDTMIWHELGTNSLYMWEDHFADYEEICTGLGIEKIPVCITEYGLMSTNGIPGESVKWISRIESSKVTGCVAYWRLADNLCDVAADDVTPNSNWWAYHWYAEMSGETLSAESKDLFQSNMGKFLTFQSDGLKYKGFTGLATVDEDKQEIQILAGGSDRDSTITLKHLDETSAFKDVETVCVTAEYVDYKGLEGDVYAPKSAFVRYLPVKNGTVTIELDDILYTQCYHITITPTAFKWADYESGIYSVVGYESEKTMRRYEAEDAALFGTAKVQENVAYAASQGSLVYADSAEESGVEFTVDIPEDGTYSLDLIYGNGANGVQYNDDGTIADKGERTSVELSFSVDGKEPQSVWELASTLKDDFTRYISPTVDLTKGTHTIRFILLQNVDCNQTVSFDFLDVTPLDDMILGAPYCEKNTDKSNHHVNAFWVIPNVNGYYNLHFSCQTAPTALTVNGTTVEAVPFRQIDDGAYRCTVFLRKGINQISVDAADADITEVYWFDGGENDNTADYFAEDFRLSGTAKLEMPAAKSMEPQAIGSFISTYVDEISSDSDSSASVTYTAPQAGYYQILFTYTNNEEGGAHDYNVDLVERYITLSVNGEKRGNTYFRSTYSWEAFGFKVITVYLEEGENTITFSNDGSYKFNGKTAFAPRIARVAVSPIVISES